MKSDRCDTERRRGCYTRWIGCVASTVLVMPNTACGAEPLINHTSVSKLMRLHKLNVESVGH